MVFKKLLLIFVVAVSLFGCSLAPTKEVVNLADLPEFSGEPYVIVNDNIPDFEEGDKNTNSFERYSDLDMLGRCGVAYANVSKEVMPVESRGSIGQVKPSGWQTVKYDQINGKYLYNRCHLIGFQLTGENANEKNLITGTRYMNTEGMLPFENMVADYVKETDNHVLYRVTPVYDGDHLVASGVLMEAESVEDNGEGIQYCVYVYNVQPGITIDYSNGDSHSNDETDMKEVVGSEIRGNKKSKIYHCPGQAAYESMKDSKNLIVFNNEEEAIEAGYRKAKQ